MPSMRALMTAGPALERNNVAGFNCAYMPVDSPRAFDEAMFVLMCGTGVGFSVEQKNVDKLPIVNEHFEDTNTTIVVADSKEGWARSLRELVGLLYMGQVPKWDVSRVRPAGARLKTFGGRASGPAPLESLFGFVVQLFKNAAGRRLSTIECHDIMCKIGEVVVVGGVRRSAMISLSDLNDRQIRNAKMGTGGKESLKELWQITVQRISDDRIRVLFWRNGNHYTILTPVNAECSAETQVSAKLRGSDDVTPTMLSELIRAVRSYFDHTNSVTSVKLWYDLMTHEILSDPKQWQQQSSELFNPH